MIAPSFSEACIDRCGFIVGRLPLATLGPILEGRECQRRVLAHAGEAEAHNQKSRTHGLAAGQELLELLAGRIGASTGRARRQLDIDQVPWSSTGTKDSGRRR